MKKLLFILFLAAFASPVLASSKVEIKNSSFSILVKKAIPVTDVLSCGLTATYSYTPAQGMTTEQILNEIAIIHNRLEILYCSTPPTAE
jgi:uncharacterized protein involved in propanediol utilization